MIRSFFILAVFLGVFFFSVVRPVLCQQSESSVFLELQDLNGGAIITKTTFDGSSLWGYIDGGADLYLEYGFKKLYLQEIRKDGIPYKIEIYQMNDPESAFGIFSVSRFKCKRDSSIPALNCVMPYQIQLVIGSCYISIINQKASAGEQAYTRFLCDQIVKNIKPEPFIYPELFCDSVYALDLDRLMMMKGPIGLMNGFPDWSDRFEKYSDYRMYLLPIQYEGFELNLALLEFKNTDDRTFFSKSLNPDGDSEKELLMKKLNEHQRMGVVSLPGTSLIYFQTTFTEKELGPYLEPIKKNNY